MLSASRWAAALVAAVAVSTSLPAHAQDPGPATDQVRRSPRVIKLDDLALDPAEHLLRAAPIDTSIILNLKKVEREPERRWSLHLSFGASQADLRQSVERARLMERFGRAAFGSIQAGALQMGWTDEGPTDPSTGLQLRGDVRFRVNPLVTLETEFGYSSALTSFYQPGFGFDEKAEVKNLTGGLLLTLPWRLWRFGFYAGGGGGVLLGKTTSQLFIASVNSVPFYLTSEATGNAAQYHVRGGGEVYVAKFVSLTVEAQYRWAKIDELKYADDARLKAINETDTPIVWTDYVFDFANQSFGWWGDPSRPVRIDFSGASLTAGLRYHF